MKVGQRIPAQLILFSLCYLLCSFISIWSDGFCPPPRAPFLRDMPPLSSRREGGCLLFFLPNPTRLRASIRERTPEKCSFCKITAHNHSWNSRSSVIQTESREVDYAREGDWLYFRIGGMLRSVDSIQHPQAIMRITAFSLQAAHLLAQTPFFSAPQLVSSKDSDTWGV